jgi:hypothetical protein
MSCILEMQIGDLQFIQRVIITNVCLKKEINFLIAILAKEML